MLSFSWQADQLISGEEVSISKELTPAALSITTLICRTHLQSSNSPEMNISYGGHLLIIKPSRTKKKLRSGHAAKQKGGAGVMLISRCPLAFHTVMQQIAEVWH